MRVAPEQNESPEFIAEVQAVANGLLRVCAPPELILIKINNWFGHKWLAFSGKALGVLGVWNSPLTIPPFVPNRVVSQRRFSAPAYEEVDAGRPIHKRIPSVDALLRRVADVAPGAAMMWYSGESLTTGRGSLMVYVPSANSYSRWYAEWGNCGLWCVTHTKGISAQRLSKLRAQEIDIYFTPAQVIGGTDADSR